MYSEENEDMEIRCGRVKLEEDDILDYCRCIMKLFPATIEAGGVFQCSAVVILKKVLRTSVLYICPFNSMSFLLATVVELI